MKNFGRAIIKTLLIGGTIATGFALHSTNAMAAELDEADVPACAPEEGALDGEVTETDSKLQNMEDAVGVIEGDAVAEEGYLKQAEDAISDESLTEEQAEEIKNGGEAVLEQATEKKEQVEEAYKTVAEETVAATEEFNNQAEANGLEEYTKEVEGENDSAKKIELLDESIQKIYDDTASLESEIGEDSEEYKRIQKEMEDAYALCQDIEWDLDNVWWVAYQHYLEEIARLEEEYEKNCENEAYYEQQFAELSEKWGELERLKNEYKIAEEELNYWNEEYYIAVNSYVTYLMQLEGLEEYIIQLRDEIAQAEIEGNQDLKEELSKKIEELQTEHDNLIPISEEAGKKSAECKEKLDEATEKYGPIIEQDLEEMESGLVFEEHALGAGYSHNLDRKETIERELQSNKEKAEIIDQKGEKLVQLLIETNDRASETESKLEEYSSRVTAQKEKLTSFEQLVSNYKSGLAKDIQAKALLDTAITEYNKVEEAYSNLVAAIANYSFPVEKDTLVQAMEEALSALESAAKEEKDYLTETEKGIKDNTITVEKAEEIIHAAEAVYNKAKGTKEQFDKAYLEAHAKLKAAREELENISNDKNYLLKLLEGIDENSESYKNILETIANYEKEIKRIEAEMDSDEYKQNVAELERLRNEHAEVSAEYENNIKLQQQYRDELNDTASAYMPRINELYDSYEAELAKLEAMEDGPEKHLQEERVNQIYGEFYSLYTEYISIIDPLNDQLSRVDEAIEFLNSQVSELINAIGNLELNVYPLPAELSYIKSELASLLEEKSNYENEAEDIRNSIAELDEKARKYQKDINSEAQVQETKEKAEEVYKTIGDTYNELKSAVSEYKQSHQSYSVETIVKKIIADVITAIKNAPSQYKQVICCVLRYIFNC